MATRRYADRANKAHTRLGQAAVQVFAANERMNQMLIEHLDPALWRAQPPGKVRTIAAIFTHMHNIRTKWVRLSAPYIRVPRQLNRTYCTPQQACAGLAESAACCMEMLAEALDGEAASRSLCATVGRGPGPLAWRRSATCLRMKLITADRCACWRINSAPGCRIK
jgi:hypothetical protein